MKKAIYVFTNDLRITDNPAIEHLHNNGMNYIPVFIDYNPLVPELAIFPVNAKKKKFLIDAISHLQEQLLHFDKELVIFKEFAGIELIKIAEESGCKTILMNNHNIPWLHQIMQNVELELSRKGIYVEYFDSNYLLDLNDINFPLSRTPDSFKSFLSRIRGSRLKDDISHQINLSNTLQTLLAEIQEQAIPELLPYKTVLNNHFSKFLPFLTIGQITPGELIKIIEEWSNIEMYGPKAKKILVKQLLKLDFIRAQFRGKIKNKQFRIQDLDRAESNKLDDWINGQTDSELINAIMHKLKSKSNISLTSKRYTILYYLFVLELPPYYGYKYFENQLLEFDPGLNFYLWYQYDANHLSSKEVLTEIASEHAHLDPEFAFTQYWK